MRHSIAQAYFTPKGASNESGAVTIDIQPLRGRMHHFVVFEATAPASKGGTNSGRHSVVLHPCEEWAQ